jgi:hypothetical protein
MTFYLFFEISFVEKCKKNFYLLLIMGIFYFYFHIDHSYKTLYKLKIHFDIVLGPIKINSLFNIINLDIGFI